MFKKLSEIIPFKPYPVAAGESFGWRYFEDNRPASIDPKPLWAPHCMIIQEDDTEDYYIFDANDKIWKKLMADLR